MRTVRVSLSDDRREIEKEKEKERERESKILLVLAYSWRVPWLCLSWAKHAKPDKYNVAADLSYTSSDQMSVR